jgi:deoxyribodipyrimidine photolyase-related protein
MGLHADGGTITTKPYISASSYILKMSDLRRGPWGAVWDGLFWRFVARHHAFFDANPRLSVMARQLERMDGAKRRAHLAAADAFLDALQ